MKLFKAGSRSSELGPAEWFTGTVWLDEILEVEGPSTLRVHNVTFEPAARTAWHSHPIGQVLHVASGTGWVQAEGSAPQLVHPGDTIWILPNEKHWHGAVSDQVFVHLAVQEAAADGMEATWFDHVTDADYQAADSNRSKE
jgi:quercetin dioxygenase-like cupin family protein